MSVESNYDLGLTAVLSSYEKQIQQSYRPIIGVHKWFARRPGALFRGLLLSEFGGGPLSERYFESNELAGVVLDPFMGGGTPLFEAVRVGLSVIGCDVNPMARWIVEREIEAIDLGALRTWGAEIAARASLQVGQYYWTRCRCGKDVPVKYFLWVKTQPCEACSAQNRLFPGHLVAAHGRHHRDVVVCPDCLTLTEFDPGSTSFDCSSCQSSIPRQGMARRNKLICRSCGWENRYPPITQDGPPAHELFAIEYHCADCKKQFGGRFYKSPDRQDLVRFREASRASVEMDSPYWPSDRIPAGDETRRLHRWGYHYYRDLFGDRQLVALHHIADAVASIPDEGIRAALGTVFSDFLRYQNMLCRYDTMALKCQDIFSVHGYPVGLIQCENNPLGITGVGGGGWTHFVQKYMRAKEYCASPFETDVSGRRKVRRPTPSEHIVATMVETPRELHRQRSALLHLGSITSLDLPNNSVDAVLTDPPYYDNVQYAELIDFCYVWLKRIIDSSIFATATTRTTQELTGNTTEDRGLASFAAGLAEVFTQAAKALKPGGLFAFTYHHNDLGAYAAVAVALLVADLVPTEALICPAEMRASLHIHGTESSTMDTVFVCRKRPAKALADFSCSQFGARQLLELGSSGLSVRAGDVRCMALGIATVRAVQKMQHDSWDGTRALVEETLAKASLLIEKEFDAIAEELRGHLDASAQKGQLALALDSH